MVPPDPNSLGRLDWRGRFSIACAPGGVAGRFLERGQTLSLRRIRMAGAAAGNWFCRSANSALRRALRDSSGHTAGSGAVFCSWENVFSSRYSRQHVGGDPWYFSGALYSKKTGITRSYGQNGLIG